MANTILMGPIVIDAHLHTTYGELLEITSFIMKGEFDNLTEAGTYYKDLKIRRMSDDVQVGLTVNLDYMKSLVEKGVCHG